VAGFVLAAPLLVPAAAILTDRHSVVRGRLPRVGWLRRALNAVLPGNRRTRLRKRWPRRWASATSLPPWLQREGFFVRLARPRSPGERARIHQVIGGLQAAPGLWWQQRALSGPFARDRLAPLPDAAVVDWLVAAVGLEGGVERGPRLPDASLQIEAAALRLARAGNAMLALALLRAGRQHVYAAGLPMLSGKRTVGTTADLQRLRAMSGVLRLFDLSAVLALKSQPDAGLLERTLLADEMEALLQLAVGTGLPRAVAPMASPVRMSKHDPTQRRRRGRQAGNTAEAAFLEARLRQRIANWRQPRQRWLDKWRRKDWVLQLSAPPLRGADDATTPALPAAGRRS